MMKKIKAKARVFLNMTKIFLTNIVKDEYCLTAKECEVSAYLLSILGFCERSIRYCDLGLEKCETTKGIKASLRMSMALSSLKMKKKHDAERYFEASLLLLRDLKDVHTKQVCNARKSKTRYDKLKTKSGRLSSVSAN